jgi:hypothetical protein
MRAESRVYWSITSFDYVFGKKDKGQLMSKFESGKRFCKLATEAHLPAGNPLMSKRSTFHPMENQSRSAKDVKPLSSSQLVLETAL